MSETPLFSEQNGDQYSENGVKKRKISTPENIHLYGGYLSVFDQETLDILKHENLSDISSDRMQSIIENTLSNINERTSVTIFAFLLELERHQIKFPLQNQNELSKRISQSIDALRTFLPDKLKHFKFDTLKFQDEHHEHEIPFSTFLIDYLISFLVKSTTKEIQNSVDRYFSKEEPFQTSGIELILGNAFKSIKHIQNGLDDIDEDISQQKYKYSDFSEEEHTMLQTKRVKIKHCSSNSNLFNILRKDEYNMDLFNILLEYPDKLESFILFLYINCEEIYRIFLRNLLVKCNADEQSKILEYFLDVKIEDLHFFNTENISKMMRKRMDREFLSKRISDLPKDDIIELLKYNFSFFIDNFERFDISTRDLLQAAEESNEILEYLFLNANKIGAFIIGSTMRILSGKSGDFTLSFFRKRISELERAKFKVENRILHTGHKTLGVDSSIQDINMQDSSIQDGNIQKVENPMLEMENMKDLENSVCEAVLIFLKHNQPSNELLDVFKSQYLLKNMKYFFSVISILDKGTIRSKILDFLDQETYTHFSSVLSANEILDELCFIRYQRYKGASNRYFEILNLILSKMTESSIVQTLMQVETSPNYLVILKVVLEKIPNLKSFIITALKRISPRDIDYVKVLELLQQSCVSVLVTKDSSFIHFCIKESDIIKQICTDFPNKDMPGYRKIHSVLFE